MLLTEADKQSARAICEDQYGLECPDPGMHIRMPDGSVGPHAWVMQAIKDANNAADQG